MRWVLLVGLVACNFEHGSLQQPARDGSTIDTWTVIDVPPGDAPATMPDARPDASTTTGPTCTTATCMAADGTCNNGTCEITAQNGQSVTCPAATRCAIDCPNDTQSCRNGMTCAASSNCAINCEPDHVCDNTTLTCANGSTCEIFCKGSNSCVGTPITCAIGATCKYHCCGTNSCGSTFGCSGGGTCINAGSTNCP